MRQIHTHVPEGADPEACASIICAEDNHYAVGDNKRDFIVIRFGDLEPTHLLAVCLDQLAEQGASAAAVEAVSTALALLVGPGKAAKVVKKVKPVQPQHTPKPEPDSEA